MIRSLGAVTEANGVERSLVLEVSHETSTTPSRISEVP